MTPRFLVLGDWVGSNANGNSNYEKANRFKAELCFGNSQFQAPARYSRQSAVGQTRAWHLG